MTLDMAIYLSVYFPPGGAAWVFSSLLEGEF